ncbi:two-component sensor histidine kinase [Calothrix sp. NIES-4071]|nr:two-component sensor histidine kinase [Calothrix sp. NIES-4071]BAZ60039.1 two-component sensor histidine kinase [Calothrix sp. NIES-4105]
MPTLLLQDAPAVREHITIARELDLLLSRASVQAPRSPFLANSDLCSAINKIITQISLVSDTEIIYQVKGTPYSLPSEVESNLLRIGQ